jgi:hypothetical protein
METFFDGRLSENTISHLTRESVYCLSIWIVFSLNRFRLIYGVPINIEYLLIWKSIVNTIATEDDKVVKIRF